MADVTKSELATVPAFQDLPDEELEWFLNESEEIHLATGDMPFH